MGGKNATLFWLIMEVQKTFLYNSIIPSYFKTQQVAFDHPNRVTMEVQQRVYI